MTVPNYPLPYDPSDDRLDDDLVGLVADLIQFRTGYPDIDGPDLDRLREALRNFLYRSPLTPEPIAEHYETNAWKGDGPGSCGIECACGVTYDGFDTLAEATQQLRWHIADPAGQDYGRADTAEADDPTPVSGVRVPPHTGGLTEQGLVDETGGVEIRCSCGDEPDSNCRVHASRFRRPCDDPAPHAEHPWSSPAVLGSARWTCPGAQR
jgi:hypothetical protein